MFGAKKSYFVKTSKDKRIYLDYASAPPVLPEALRAMRDAEKFVGNPGAIHREGVEAKHALDDARTRIAALLEVKASEIIFTSGLTEANNIAILGAARAMEIFPRLNLGYSENGLNATRGLTSEPPSLRHWIVSAIEHSSVLDCFGEVERMSGTVSFVEPDARGIISPEAVQKLLRPETVFVSIGWANNEIGTIQPLAKIARVIREHEKDHKTTILFHSDAGQAPLYLPSTAHSLGVDLLSLGGNKLYGPHGVGALFVSTGTLLTHVLHGGPQEKNLKPGTENVALAQGFAAAFEIVAKEREVEAKRLESLRENFASEILARIPGAVINGDLKHSLPHMLNVSLKPGIEVEPRYNRGSTSIPTANVDMTAEYICLALDTKGIALSTKSACREGEESRSHVVEALGPAKSALSSEVLTKEERAQNTLRFSLGRETKDSDLKRVVAELEHLAKPR